MRKHRVDAGPDTVHWGFFDASLKPLITIDPGDEVTLSTVSGPPEAMPKADSGLAVPPALSAIHASVPQRLGPHIMTGPVAVRGAKAGQVLEVRIKSITLHYDWGYNVIRPLAGALPDDFATMRLIHIPLDRARMSGRLPWGLELPLKPFFGVMVVAPPPAWGPVGSPPPRRNGGNMDNKELVAGSTLYLPIHVDGALFSVGDGHGVQGDGEVCITAIETGLIGTFELHVRDDFARMADGGNAERAHHHGFRPRSRRCRCDRAAQHDKAYLLAHRDFGAFPNRIEPREFRNHELTS
jgi:acetamidase/formamidase